MRDLIKRLEEATVSTSVVALFDGETMVMWPREPGGWPYYANTAPSVDDMEIADSIPSYDMAEKQKDLADEIIKGQEVGNPGVWKKLKTSEKTLRDLSMELGV